MEKINTFLKDLKPLFVSNGRLRSYEKEEYVFYKDDPGDRVYLIENGIVKIINYSECGKELVFSVLHDGDIFGEMSVLDQKPRSACALAVSKIKVYELEGKTFINHLKQNPALLLDMIRILSERLRDTNTFVEDTVFLNLSSRILNRLLKISEHCGVNKGNYIEISHNFSQKELAGLVGCTRENLSKELKLLKDAGIIDYDSKSGIKIYTYVKKT